MEGLKEILEAAKQEKQSVIESFEKVEAELAEGKNEFADMFAQEALEAVEAEKATEASEEL